MGKTMAQCMEAVSRAKRVEAHNARLETLIALKDAKLKRQAEELEELKASKLFALGQVKDLKGQIETLIVEATQAEVFTRTIALEQVVRGSLTPESAKKELEAMVALHDES